jgi:hypothetical protein
MGTFDTRGERALDSNICDSEPSELSETILGMLESAGINSEINDAICKLIAEGELKAAGTNYEPKGKLIGRKCTICTCQLSIEVGDNLTRSHPDSSTVVYCEHCDHQEMPTDDDLEFIKVQQD